MVARAPAAARARRSARRCWRARSRRRARSGGGSPPTCTTASCRTSPASRSGSPRWPTTAQRRGDAEEAAALRDAVRAPAPGRARPAHAAGRDPPAEPRLGRPRRRAQRPAEPARGSRRAHASCRSTTDAIRARRRARSACSTASRARRVRNARAARRRRARSRIALTRAAPGRLRLVVADDGRGFDAGERARAASAEGHVGLSLLDGLAAQAGGTLDVRSAPGDGTTVDAGGAGA